MQHSPYPFFVNMTGFRVSWTVSEISAKLLRKSDTGRICGIVSASLAMEDFCKIHSGAQFHLTCLSPKV